MTDLTKPPSVADEPLQSSPSEVPAPARKTPIYKTWWFWAVTVVVLGAIGAGGGALATKTADPASLVSNDQATQTHDGAAPSSGEPTGTATVPPGEPALEEPDPVPAEASPPAAETGKWVRVIQMRGFGNERSTPFRLTGGAIRLKYSVSGNEVRADIYVLEEDAVLRGVGGVPAVMAIGAVSDEIELEREAGSYCLEVTTAHGSWVVTIDEQR